MTIEAISSAIYNDVVSGLRGLTSNPTISMEQLQDEVVAERNTIIKEYLLKGIITLEDLYLAINCIEVDCDYMSKCCNLPVGKKALHFEIPATLNLGAVNTIKFIGSIDRQVSYAVYTDESYKFHEYRKRSNQSPYVYVDPTINNNGNLDCYVFNAPYAKYLSVVALFKDPRKVIEWDCCSDLDVYLDCGLISTEIQKRLTEKKLRYYRQALAPVLPNDQVPK